MRENQIVARKDTTLHYVADTEPGSSGSPVLNVQFGLVALHHWGSPHRDLTDDKGKLLPKTINEGIRASSIYTDLTTLNATLKAGSRSLIAEALQIGLKEALCRMVAVAVPPAMKAPARTTAAARPRSVTTARRRGTFP